jgi:hypothetical protein
LARQGGAGLAAFGRRLDGIYLAQPAIQIVHHMGGDLDPAARVACVSIVDVDAARSPTRVATN